MGEHEDGDGAGFDADQEVGDDRQCSEGDGGAHERGLWVLGSRAIRAAIAMPMSVKSIVNSGNPASGIALSFLSTNDTPAASAMAAMANVASEARAPATRPWRHARR